eukprot:gene6834-7052_t
MKDLATLQEGQSGQDLLTRLQTSLSRIEQYAVRHLEAQRPVDVEAAAAAAVEDLKKEEWELDAIEKRKEQQEYQEQIAAMLAAEEKAAAEAAAAAAAAAEGAELMEVAGGGYSGYGSGYGYDNNAHGVDYSGYELGGVCEGGEVTSPGQYGLRKRGAAGGWEYSNLPSRFSPGQQMLPPYKKHKAGADWGQPAAAAAAGIYRSSALLQAVQEHMRLNSSSNAYMAPPLVAYMSVNDLIEGQGWKARATMFVQLMAPRYTLLPIVHPSLRPLLRLLELAAGDLPAAGRLAGSAVSLAVA